MTLKGKQRRFVVDKNDFPAALTAASVFCTPESALHTMHSGVAKRGIRFDSARTNRINSLSFVEHHFEESLQVLVRVCRH
jgi:hypothetical protein